jgi:hypothetical protein
LLSQEAHKPKAEIKGERQAAEANYRVALEDPAYNPAQRNLDRITRRPYTRLGIDWGYQTDRNP